MTYLESKIQSNCVLWFRTQYAKTTIFAIPNGGNRSAITGAILKREGVIAGVADLFVVRANSKYAGLFIEIKSASGKRSIAQDAFMQSVLAAGYAYYTCYSLEEFAKAVKTYMDYI